MYTQTKEELLIKYGANGVETGSTVTKDGKLVKETTDISWDEQGRKHFTETMISGGQRLSSEKIVDMNDNLIEEVVDGLLKAEVFYDHNTGYESDRVISLKDKATGAWINDKSKDYKNGVMGMVRTFVKEEDLAKYKNTSTDPKYKGISLDNPKSENGIYAREFEGTKDKDYVRKEVDPKTGAVKFFMMYASPAAQESIDIAKRANGGLGAATPDLENAEPGKLFNKVYTFEELEGDAFADKVTISKAGNREESTKLLIKIDKDSKGYILEPGNAIESREQKIDNANGAGRVRAFMPKNELGTSAQYTAEKIGNYDFNQDVNNFYGLPGGQYKLINEVFANNGINLNKDASITPERLANAFNELKNIPNLLDVLKNNQGMAQARKGTADNGTILQNKKKLGEIFPSTLGKYFKVEEKSNLFERVVAEKNKDGKYIKVKDYVYYDGATKHYYRTYLSDELYDKYTTSTERGASKDRTTKDGKVIKAAGLGDSRASTVRAYRQRHLYRVYDRRT